MRFGAYGLGAAVLILILSRFGLHWLGVAATAIWALLKTVTPLVLRLLPLARLFGTARARQRGPHASSDGSGANAEEGPGQGPVPRQPSMTRKEAQAVLGTAEGASREEIQAAYKSLIRKVHPDSPGGSTYLATKLNQAKDVLLS